MNFKTLTIPYLLESVTEREIMDEIAPQLQGTVVRVQIVPSFNLHKGSARPSITAIISYKPWFIQNHQVSPNGGYCPSREEWTKSRNFP